MLRWRSAAYVTGLRPEYSTGAPQTLLVLNLLKRKVTTSHMWKIQIKHKTPEFLLIEVGVKLGTKKEIRTIEIFKQLTQ